MTARDRRRSLARCRRRAVTRRRTRVLHTLDGLTLIAPEWHVHRLRWDRDARAGLALLSARYRAENRL